MKLVILYYSMKDGPTWALYNRQQDADKHFEEMAKGDETLQRYLSVWVSSEEEAKVNFASKVFWEADDKRGK